MPLDAWLLRYDASVACRKGKTLGKRLRSLLRSYPRMYGGYCRRGGGNCIDHCAARVALDIRHISAFLDDDATVAVRAGGDFVRDDQVTPFVLMHDL